MLTIGFARRNATYKRISLLINDPVRALGLLSGDRSIQLVLAGKAHPSDVEAKQVVQNLFRFKDAPNVMERVVYLHDYDLGLAARFVRGCDVWLNLPRPPYEASGTSGMKAAATGGLTERARWLVGGGVRRGQRVGAARRRRGRFRRPGRAGRRTPFTA